MFTPLFYTLDGQNVHFIYQTKLKYGIASGSNIGGLEHFVIFSSACFVHTKKELNAKLFDLNYGHLKFPTFPCVMCKSIDKIICNSKGSYITLLEAGYQLEEK